MLMKGYINRSNAPTGFWPITPFWKIDGPTIRLGQWIWYVFVLLKHLKHFHTSYRQSSQPVLFSISSTTSLVQMPGENKFTDKKDNNGPLTRCIKQSTHLMTSTQFQPLCLSSSLRPPFLQAFLFWPFVSCSFFTWKFWKISTGS